MHVMTQALLRHGSGATDLICSGGAPTLFCVVNGSRAVRSLLTRSPMHVSTVVPSGRTIMRGPGLPLLGDHLCWNVLKGAMKEPPFPQSVSTRGGATTSIFVVDGWRAVSSMLSAFLRL